MTLKTMGCATCEPITLLAGGSLTQNKNPGVKLGSIASAPANFTCTAVVMNSNGGMVSTVPMEQAGEDVYTGVWDASNAAKGYYQVTIKASVAGVSKSFPDALTIAII
jgi:hypothetical protein